MVRDVMGGYISTLVGHGATLLSHEQGDSASNSALLAVRNAHVILAVRHGEYSVVIRPAWSDDAAHLVGPLALIWYLSDGPPPLAIGSSLDEQVAVLAANLEEVSHVCADEQSWLAFRSRVDVLRSRGEGATID